MIPGFLSLSADRISPRVTILPLFNLNPNTHTTPPMARSVSIHPNAVSFVYLNLTEELDGLDFHDAFEDLILSIQNALIQKIPSYLPTDRWADRESHVILQSIQSEVSVSEYNGIVAVCIAPRDPWPDEWAKDATPIFRKALHEAFPTAAMVSLGRASNGEEFFAPASSPRLDAFVTSKEGVLW